MMAVRKKRKQLLSNSKTNYFIVQKTHNSVFELNFLMDVLLTMLSFPELLQVRSISQALQIKWTPKIINMKGKFWRWKQNYETTSFFPHIKRLQINENVGEHQKHLIVFPPKVKTIDLFNCRVDFDWNSRFLPDSTEILALPGYIKINSWNPQMLPINLKHLHFENVYSCNPDFKHMVSSLPLTLLSFTPDIGLQSISRFLFPNQLLYLDIRYCLLKSDQITSIVLPIHLQVLKITLPKNRIPLSFIPTSLQRLYILSVREETIFQGDANLLPGSLFFMKLEINSGVNVSSSMFPSSLKTLKLEHYRITQSSYFSQLPCHLQRFSLRVLMPVVKYDKLPEHLVHFSFKTSPTGFFPARFLPLGLQILKLKWGATISFDDLIFSSPLRCFLQIFIFDSDFHKQTISSFAQKWNGKFKFVVSEFSDKTFMNNELNGIEKLLQTFR